MKQTNKKNILYISLSIIIFLITITIIKTNTTESLLTNEIGVIEQLRTLYYSNFDLFPDFLFNLGNGQSIYILSEYGLLSPITLVSYIFPYLSTKLYLNIITIIIHCISLILIYNFFNKKSNNQENSFLLTIIFNTITLVYTYTNPLLVCHILLLIISLYGVDKVFDNKKSYLLIISVFLMLLNNLNFSITGIISILIYSIYRYLEHMNTITVKSFIKRISSIIFPIIVSLICSSIILIPTLINIIKNDTMYKPNIIDIPLLFILIPSIINYIRKDKTNITISIILISLIILNILTNIPLISFIPLYLIIIEDFITKIYTKKINIKPTIIISPIIYSILIYLNNNIFLTIELILLIIVITIYYKTSIKNTILIPLSIYMLITPILINNQPYVSEQTINKEETLIKHALTYLNRIDKTTYRTHIDLNSYHNTNYANPNYNSSTINLDTSNSLYNTFNQETLINNENYNNIFSLILNNNKYIISRYKPLQGYELISRHEDIYIYKNENTLPIGFATTEVMSYEDFSKLDKYTKQEALLNLIVADTTSNNNFIQNTKEISLPIEEIFNSEDIYINNDYLTINTKERLILDYELPEKYQNKIVFISMDVKTTNNKTIKINNITKNISGKETIDYIISSKELTNLVLTFTKGQYTISNIKFYLLDYANIENINNKIIPLNIDQLNTKGDTIIGNIETNEDTYFMLTIPYDSGFTILIDNQKINYEKVNEVYIGFPLPAGYHSIEIEYHANGKIIGYLLSTLGLISFITIVYFESKRQFY